MRSNTNKTKKHSRTKQNIYSGGESNKTGRSYIKPYRERTTLSVLQITELWYTRYLNNMHFIVTASNVPVIACYDNILSNFNFLTSLNSYKNQNWRNTILVSPPPQLFVALSVPESTIFCGSESAVRTSLSVKRQHTRGSKECFFLIFIPSHFV